MRTLRYRELTGTRVAPTVLALLLTCPVVSCSREAECPETSCNSGGGGSPAGASSAVGGVPGVGGSPTGGSGGTDEPVETDRSGLPESYRPTTYVFPEPDDAVTCSGAENQSAMVGEIFLSQTHALSPNHPLFFLVAKRPALLEVPVTGTGPAPEVRVEAFVNGTSLGVLCLDGPASLPATVDTTVHRRFDRFTATLPAAWLVPGLSLTVNVGLNSVVYDADELNVGAAPDLNLIVVPFEVLNYDEGKPQIEPPNTWLGDLAAACPASLVRLASLPKTIPLPELIASSDASGAPPARLVARPCEGGETTTDGCQDTNISSFNVLATVYRVTSALHRASGDFAFSYYYGFTGHLSAGGLGSGKTFATTGFDGVMLHELGHALNLPHWGEVYPGENPADSEFQYPYGGDGSDGGGRGESWNYYQNIAEFVSPVCEIEENGTFGRERSDGMQRSNPCLEMRSTGTGPWDGFGDFSAAAMFRTMVGASEPKTGMVAYRGGSVPFQLKTESGWPNLVLNDDGSRSLVREHQPIEPTDPEKFPFLLPERWDVPVATVYGSFHPAGGDANLVYEPVVYQGNLPSIVDPTDPDTFADLAAFANGAGPYEDYFYWPRDITVKVTYEDGEVIHAIYLHGSYDREWATTTYSGPWRGDLVYFAMNFPGEKRIDLIEVYERPFVTRWTGDDTVGNITYPPNATTADTFMDDAVLRGSWARERQ